MDPIAFELGALQIRWYGIAMALSMLLGAWIAARLLDKIGRDGEKMWDGLFWIILFGVIGARLGYIVTSPGHVFYDGARWWEPFAVWHGGLSIHGGVILAVLAAYFYFKKAGIPLLEALDCMSPGMALGIILVRIGNFMNGDILGYQWEGPWAFNFPNDLYHLEGYKDFVSTGTVLRHPTELYGLMVGVICLLFVSLIWRLTYGKSKKFLTGAALFYLVIVYSLARAVIEDPFRKVPLAPKWVDPEISGYGLVTMSQWASLVLILFGIWGLSRLKNWDKKRAAAIASGKIPAPGEAGAVVRQNQKSRQERRAKEREARKHGKK